MMRTLFAVVLLVSAVCADAAPRARDLGVPFEGIPGRLNASTDVAGVTVGRFTRIGDVAGEPANGRKICTGVTAILPRGRASLNTPVFSGWFALNGNGEMTGTAWLEESGQLEGPVLLTNTHSVGVVRDAAIAWRVREGGADASGHWWSLAVVAETGNGHRTHLHGLPVPRGAVPLTALLCVLTRYGALAQVHRSPATAMASLTAIGTPPRGSVVSA